MAFIENGIVKSAYPPQKIPNDMSIPLFLRQEAEEETLDLPFIFDFDYGIGYSRRQVLEQSQRFCNALKKFGLKKGEFVAFMLPNIPEYFPSFLGAMEAGLVPVHFYYAFTKYELEKMAEGLRFAAILTTSDQIPKLNQVQAFSEVQMVVCVDDAELQCSEPIQESVSYHKLISEANSDFDPISCNGDDLAFIIFSSGTTGLPKKVKISHRNVIAGLKFIDHIAVGCVNDAMLSVSQFYNVTGIWVTTRAFYQCFQVITLRKFVPARYIEAIKKCKPTLILAPAALMSFIANSPELNRTDFVSVKSVFTCGATVKEALRSKFAKKVGDRIPIQIGYGSSETVTSVTLLPLHLARQQQTSVGFVVPNLEMKIVTPESTTPLKPNEKGELCFRGIQVFKGYLNNEEATARTLDADGWFHSGDFGYYDEYGLVYVEGRIKDLIKTNANQVSPEEIENVIRKLGHVQDVVVFGIEDEKYGKVPRALVVRNSDDLHEEDVADIVKENLIPYKHLRGGVRFVKELPISSIGKVLRREARAWDSEN